MLADKVSLRTAGSHMYIQDDDKQIMRRSVGGWTGYMEVTPDSHLSTGIQTKRPHSLSAKSPPRYSTT